MEQPCLQGVCNMRIIQHSSFLFPSFFIAFFFFFFFSFPCSWWVGFLIRPVILFQDLDILLGPFPLQRTRDREWYGRKRMEFRFRYGWIWIPPSPLSSGSAGKESTSKAGDTRDTGSVSGPRKIPWKRKWPVFLPEKFHGQKSLVGYSPVGHKDSDMTENTQHSSPLT